MIYTLNLPAPRTEYNALTVYTIKNTILTTLYFHKQADIHYHYTTIIIVLLTEPTPSFTIHDTILTPQHFQKTNNQRYHSLPSKPESPPRFSRRQAPFQDIIWNHTPWSQRAVHPFITTLPRSPQFSPRVQAALRTSTATAAESPPSLRLSGWQEFIIPAANALLATQWTHINTVKSGPLMGAPVRRSDSQWEVRFKISCLIPSLLIGRPPGSGATLRCYHYYA